MKRSTVIKIAGGILVALAALTLLWQHLFTLGTMEQLIAQGYAVEQITVTELQRRITSPDSTNYVLFDVRQEEEYTTSHLPSAIQVDPQISTREFVNRYQKRFTGKHLLFYCSVGLRSAMLMERTETAILQRGGRSLLNLKGGIFRWYLQGYTLVNESGETAQIHPYNPFWGQLIEHSAFSQNPSRE